MIDRAEIQKIVKSYGGNVRVGVLGSHSALEVCLGSKEEGLRNIVVCQAGREKTYSRYYRYNGTIGIVDDVVILQKFSDIIGRDVQEELIEKHTIFVPNRSFAVYVPLKDIEDKFRVPIFGNRALLKAEERDVEKNQYYLLEKAGIKTPKRFKNYEEIDRLCIVKVSEAKRGYERAFFFTSSPEEFEKLSKEMINKGMITEEGLKKATIEEFVVGAQFNFNYFYSPLDERVELIGIDTRRQTNLDGLLRLPADQQLKVLKEIDVKNIEIGHIACTLRESMLEQVFEIGEKFVEVTKREYPPGIIGPFALQSMITPGPPREEIFVFDASLRMPGSPGIKFTPYSEYLWGYSVSMGRRIAMEIKRAVDEDRIEELVT